MNRRWLIQAVVAVVLFAVWTSIVRDGIAHGSRESVWIDRRFGDWPQEVRDVRATFDLQFSFFATYASSEATAGTRATIPELFGRPVIGSFVDGDDSQNIYGSRYSTGFRAGELASVSVFVAAPIDEPPNDQFQLAIYKDVRGAPGQLLATTASGRLVPDTWNTLPITAVLEPRMSYWLMYNSNGTNTTVNNATYSPVTGDPLDRAIRERPTQFGNRITSMGDTEPMIVAIVAIGLLAAAKRRFRLGVLVLIGFGLALLVAWGVRETIFDPYLYPSGHALRATYVAIAFSFVVTSRGARVAAWVFAALIAIYTVRTSGHYSEEVIGGALLGWAMATAAKAVSGEVRAKPVEPVIELRDSVPEASSKTPPTG